MPTTKDGKDGSFTRLYLPLTICAVVSYVYVQKHCNNVISTITHRPGVKGGKGKIRPLARYLTTVVSKDWFWKSSSHDKHSRAGWQTESVGMLVKMVFGSHFISYHLSSPLFDLCPISASAAFRFKTNTSTPASTDQELQCRPLSPIYFDSRLGTGEDFSPL